MTAPITPAPPRRLTGAVLPALAAAALAGAATMIWVWPRAASIVPPGCVLDHVQGFGGPISLTDQTGRTVTQADFGARPTLLYFGFTHCPDACPTTLYALGQALPAANAHNVQTVFVSLDPERDTPDVMRAYVATAGFPAGLTGLTGTVEQVKAAADAFRVVYRKAPIPGANADTYNIDHTSLLYLMDSHWTPRAVISSPGRTPQEIAACLSAGLASRS